MGIIGTRRRGIEPQLVGSEKLPGGNYVEVKTKLQELSKLSSLITRYANLDR